MVRRIMGNGRKTLKKVLGSIGGPTGTNILEITGKEGEKAMA
jgi:RecA/RadA recombinase